MEIYKVNTVSMGFALGKIYCFEKAERLADSKDEGESVFGREYELLRLEKALDGCEKELSSLYEDALSEGGGEKSADIFISHLMMIRDDDFVSYIKEKINELNACCEWALSLGVRKFADLLLLSDEEYIKERAGDVFDVGDRIYRHLKGKREEAAEFEGDTLIIAEDLTPGDITLLKKRGAAAFIMIGGSETSHTSLMAKGLSVPAAIGMKREDIKSGLVGAFDGEEGIFYLSPSDETVKRIKEKQKRHREREEKLLLLKDKEDVTESGISVELFANIGSAEEAFAAFEKGARGIGLFRSEFLFLAENKLPSEEDQLSVYLSICRRARGKKIIIRTLDAGSDKRIEGVSLPREENPALGMRGIRLSFENEDLLLTQIRAILRASTEGEIWIMFPMVTYLHEMERARELVERAKDQLSVRGENFGNVKVGMMVETPAAALCIEDFYEVSDFFSIGSNDLTQYILAADRTADFSKDFTDPHHRSVIGLVDSVIEKCTKMKKWIGICGELASDPILVPHFIEKGVSELSVSPSLILKTRAVIRGENI